ncbi:MAG: CRISPR system precrRNA processing endoribonuclease RAMP protein Cas6 [Smithella sp.]|jgi:CRISPR-associated endoribonuclease Cas6
MKIEVGRFQFILKATEPILLPPYKGSTLRGGFGTAFRRVVCVMKGKECAQCMLKGTCVYSYVFETPPPEDTKIMRKYKAAPHPFIIEPPAETKRDYQPGDTITFGLTLIGKAIHYLPYFIYTFDELGKTGLGKGRGKGRGSFELKTVLNHGSGVDASDGGSAIYDSATRTLNRFDTHTLTIGPIIFDNPASTPSAMTLNFLTPTRISYNSRITENIEFHMIVRNLLRRFSLLSYFHGNGEAGPEIDFKKVIEKAKTVKIASKRLHRYDWERYSGRQEQRIDMGGFVGKISFEGPVTPFVPLLKAGEVLHIGKSTVFGLGRYGIKGADNVTV